MALLEDNPRDGAGQGTQRQNRGFVFFVGCRNSNSFLLQGYELAEDEVKISLDRFRLEYTNDDGSPKYAPWFPSIALLFLQ